MKFSHQALAEYGKTRREFADLYRQAFGREMTAADVAREQAAAEMAERTANRYADDDDQSHDPAAAGRHAAHSAAVDARGPAREGYERTLDALGQIADLSDADDSFEPNESEKLIALGLFRESSYVAHCRNRAGEVSEPEVFDKSKAGAQQLRDDTYDIAFKMAGAGRSVFADPKAPRGSILDPFTGRTIAIPPVKSRKIFPTVAKTKRSKMLLALEMLLMQPEHAGDLFFTLTWQKRCVIWDLRLIITAMQRRLSKLNGQDFMKEAGAQFIFRTSEIGGMTFLVHKPSGRRIAKVKKNSVDGAFVRVRFMDEGKNGQWRRVERADLVENEHRDDRGLWLYHPHMHALLHLSRKLDPAQPARRAGFDNNGNPSKKPEHQTGRDAVPSGLDRLKNQIGNFWGDGWWGIDGKIEKVRECCKYVGKPADLRRMSGLELLGLDDALSRLHLVQPLGELKEHIRARRESVLKAVRESRTVNHDGERVREKALIVRPDWNCRKEHRRPVRKAPAPVVTPWEEQPMTQLAANHFATIAAGADEIAEIAGRMTQAGLTFEAPEVETPAAAPEARPAPSYNIANRIVARLSPAPYFDRVATPALYVWNYDGKPETLKKIQEHPAVAPMMKAVAAQMEEGRRRAAMLHVHTSPVTVRNPADPLPGLLTPAAWHPVEALCPA